MREEQWEWKDSMGHGVENNIDPHRVGFFLRELAKVSFIFPFPLPAIAQVRVVADDDHQPSLIIEDPAVMDFLSIGAFVSEASLGVSD